MALKAILDKVEGLPEPILKEYKQGEDGKFHLDIDGLDDHPGVGALKRAKDHEKTNRQSVEKLLKDSQTASEKLQNELDEIRRGAIPKGDVEKLEGSWKEKVTKLEATFTGRLEKANNSLQKLLVENVAQQMAAEISTSAELMLPHIRKRLTTEEVDGQFVTRVLDKDGKPSALSIKELQEELVTTAAYKPILVGTKASGGGASGATNRGGAPGGGNLGQMNPAELVSHLKNKKGQR
jgi:hypothetical protein